MSRTAIERIFLSVFFPPFADDQPQNMALPYRADLGYNEATEYILDWPREPLSRRPSNCRYGTIGCWTPVLPMHS